MSLNSSKSVSEGENLHCCSWKSTGGRATGLPFGARFPFQPCFKRKAKGKPLARGAYIFQVSLNWWFGWDLGSDSQLWRLNAVLTLQTTFKPPREADIMFLIRCLMDFKPHVGPFSFVMADVYRGQYKNLARGRRGAKKPRDWA